MENTPNPNTSNPEGAKRASDLCRLISALYVLAAAVIVASIIIAGTFLFTQRQALNAARDAARMAMNSSHDAASPQGAPAGQNPQQPTPPPLQPVNVSAINTTGLPFIGEANAPVTMVEWSDYQCPYCQQFELSILPQLSPSYVQTGKLKIVFKDFAFLGPDSITAAEVERAVWQAYPQDFYKWRETMFQNQGDENHNEDPNGLNMYLTWTAKVPGIDTNKIAQLVAQNKPQYDAAIKADQIEAGKFSVDGTPSFVVGNGNVPIMGGAPVQQFKKLIDGPKNDAPKK